MDPTAQRPGRYPRPMSLIDRLSKEAQKARESRELTERERLQREQNYQNVLQGRMMALHEYLEQLIAHLKELQPSINLNYQLSAYGDLPAVMLHEYKLEAERRMLSYVINIAWRARVDNERCRELKASGHTRVRQLIDQFRALHLGGISEIKQGAAGGDLLSATFHPKGFIHISMRAILHAHDPVLRLSFENLDTLGTTHKQFPGEEVDDNLFDRIGRFLVREDNALIMEALPEDLRRRLRGGDGVAASIPAAHQWDPDQVVAVDLDVQFDPESIPKGKGYDTVQPVEQPKPAPAKPATAKPAAAPKPDQAAPRAGKAKLPSEATPAPRQQTKAERDFELLHSASPKAPAPDEERMAQLIAEFEANQGGQSTGDEVVKPQIQPLSMSLLDDEPKEQPAAAPTKTVEAKPKAAPAAEQPTAPMPTKPSAPSADAAKPESQPGAAKKLDLAELEAKRREAEAFRDRMRRMAEKLRDDN